MSSLPSHRPSGNVPRYARARTVYLILLGCAVAFVLAVTALWRCVESDSPTVARFKDAYRFPEYLPAWMGYSGGEYWNVLWEKRDLMLPYLVFHWKNCQDPRIEGSGVMLGLAYGELDIDLGAPRTAVDVDGTTGWLTQLSGQVFAAVYDKEEYYRVTEGWDYDRKVYSWLLFERGYALQSGIGGAALALQWNKDGIHHLLVANTTEPMTEEILFQIANSLSPAPFPSHSEVNPGTRGC